MNQPIGRWPSWIKHHLITIWIAALCLLGIVACLLPWYRLTIFGQPAMMQGMDTWQGKTVAVFFIAAAAVGALADRLRFRPALVSILCVTTGSAAAIVSLLYLYQVEFPAPDRVVVNQGGQAGQAIANELIKNMDGELSIGAPIAMAIGLALAVLGHWIRNNAKLPVEEKPH